MNKYTVEQIESSLQRSQRLEQPLAGEHKQTFLEGLVVVKPAWYRVRWQVWISLPVAGAALAAVVWFVSYQPTGNTQLANTHANNPNHHPIVMDPIDLSVNADTLALLHGVNTLGYHDYASLGGGPEYHYSRLSITEPTWLQAPTNVAIHTRTPLTLSELYTLFDQVGQSDHQVITNEIGDIRVISADQLDITDCDRYYYDHTAGSCLQIDSRGALYYWTGPNSGLALESAEQFVARLTGQSIEHFTLDVLPAEADYPKLTEYYIYTNQLPTDQTLPFKQNGWHVILENNQLLMISGNLQPAWTEESSVDVITPQTAFQELSTGLQSGTGETFYGRVHLNQHSIDNLLVMNQASSIQIAPYYFDLVYLPVASHEQFALIPVYYLYGVDLISGYTFEAYVDAVADSQAFKTYRPR